MQTENSEKDNNYHALSLSGGKDSSALLLLMLEKDMPIDCVLYADTGMEFPEMEAHIAKLDDLLFRERGIHITTLRHSHGFEWLMFDQPKEKPNCLERRALLGVPPYGNGWPGMRVRWCMGELKTHLINKEVNRLKKVAGQKVALQYVGIAADEAHRCKDDPTKRYPLVDWNITEAHALQICYVSEEYHDKCMLDRNRRLVEQAGILLAVYNGEWRGGTAATMRYARKMGREIIAIHPVSMHITYEEITLPPA